MSQTPAAPTPPPFDPRDQRRKAFGRFLVAHMFAYVPALVWAVAWTPVAIIQSFDTLQKIADTEKVVSDFILGKIVVPAVVAGVIPHLLAIPWIRDPQRKWLVFFGVTTALGTLVGCVVALVYWARIFAGR